MIINNLILITSYSAFIFLVFYLAQLAFEQTTKEKDSGLDTLLIMFCIWMCIPGTVSGLLIACIVFHGTATMLIMNSLLCVGIIIFFIIPYLHDMLHKDKEPQKENFWEIIITISLFITCIGQGYLVIQSGASLPGSLKWLTDTWSWLMSSPGSEWFP